MTFQEKIPCDLAFGSIGTFREKQNNTMRSEELAARKAWGEGEEREMQGLSIPSWYLWKQTCQYNILLYLFIFGMD